MLSMNNGPDEVQSWMFHIDTPVGTVGISDKNEQPGGPREWDKDEIMIDLSTVHQNDWKRFVILDDSGATYNLGDMMGEFIDRQGR
jgi:hypothetical protein